MYDAEFSATGSDFKSNIIDAGGISLTPFSNAKI